MFILTESFCFLLNFYTANQLRIFANFEFVSTVHQPSSLCVEAIHRCLRLMLCVLIYNMFHLSNTEILSAAHLEVAHHLQAGLHQRPHAAAHHLPHHRRRGLRRGHHDLQRQVPPVLIQVLDQSEIELKTNAIRMFAKVSIVSYSRPSLMIIASAFQFHVYLPWGQHLFRIVS